jgi:hypothetical protein
MAKEETAPADITAPTKIGKPPAHPAAAVILLSLSAVSLGWIFDQLALFQGVNQAVSRWIDGLHIGGDLRPLPILATWAWSLLATAFTTTSLLYIQAIWQRILILLSILLLSFSWVPVLALMDFRALPGGILFSLIWGGVWTLVYAARHQPAARD